MTNSRDQGGHAISDPFEGAEHDHSLCIESAIAAATELCRERGKRLTPIRRRVLEYVWESHNPIGAYEILDRLAEAGGRATPPTVYRALDFLRGQGLVHRVQSLNAFVGCAYPGDRHPAHFLICDDCGAASEIVDGSLVRALIGAAARAGFSVEQETVELRGRCPRCRVDD